MQLYIWEYAGCLCPQFFLNNARESFGWKSHDIHFMNNICLFCCFQFLYVATQKKTTERKYLCGKYTKTKQSSLDLFKTKTHSCDIIAHFYDSYHGSFLETFGKASKEHEMHTVDIDKELCTCDYMYTAFHASPSSRNNLQSYLKVLCMSVNSCDANDSGLWWSILIIIFIITTSLKTISFSHDTDEMILLNDLITSWGRGSYIYRACSPFLLVWIWMNRVVSQLLDCRMDKVDEECKGQGCFFLLAQ